MRIVFLTNEKFGSSEEFRYMFANVAASFPDVHVVAVRRSQAERKSFLSRLQKKVRKLLWRARRFGVVHALEVLTSYPLRRVLTRRNSREAEERFRLLRRPPTKLEPEKAVYVETVNGPGTVEAISRLEPDVVIQKGAGILRRQVFEIARIGTLNLHPGIAPLIKGPYPTHWALWERRREWLGATVHYIDEGIDTGPVLAYAPVEPRYPGERAAPIYVRTIEAGVEHLVDVLCRLARGERWTIHPPRGEHVYRTTFSGWRLLLLEIRLALQRHRAALGERGEPRRVSGERRWALMLAAGAVVVMFGVFALVVAADIRQQAANIPPSGVEYVEVGPGGQHIEGNVGYAQRPPAGGEHSPRWQNCGFYDEPVPNENAVHSLEHGAVWVTYSPHLPQDQVVRLRELASEQTYVLVSPYSDLPSPVVASAWGKQLRLGAAHDADLASFLRAYRQGPQTPEAGAPCTSGVGEPQR